MENLELLINNLSKKRPIFHSEADFQHALAWEIHHNFPNDSVRLEYPFQHDIGVFYLDIVVRSKNETIAIELKYKTRQLFKNINGETFNLQNQAAQDLGRYDFLKDIHRIEKLVYSNLVTKGYCIFLTNDSAYWKCPTNLNTVDAGFRIHDGKKITGLCQWSNLASAGTKKKREEDLILIGSYTNKWIKYAFINSNAWGEFRFDSIEILGPHLNK